MGGLFTVVGIVIGIVFVSLAGGPDGGVKTAPGADVLGEATNVDPDEPPDPDDAPTNAGPPPPPPPGETFVRRHLTNADGTIKTTLIAGESTSIWATGDESLSESLGLWLLYLIDADQPGAFADGVTQLLDHFWRDGWVPWKRAPDGTQAMANALIDDLRIAEALYEATVKWDDPTWAVYADQMAASLNVRQVREGMLTDHHDYETGQTGWQLTLSYINPVPLQQMVNRGLLDTTVADRMLDLLANMPLRNGFFPFHYDVRSGDYHFDDDINLIDQLLIAYHRQRHGDASPELHAFLRERWADDHLLFGRYDTATGEPTVTYESPAVYGLAVLYALEANDVPFARELQQRMRTLQALQPGSSLYGGYMSAGDTHAFDNLIPLVAEQKLALVDERGMSDASPAP